MRIERLTLKGVTKHADTTLELPERGIVLVTGDNGSGKSSVIEAVPLCFWGKTMRKADLWNEKLAAKPSVEVVADGTTFTRKAKGRVRFTWDGAAKHESTKEAQRDFDDARMTFDHWRRACVLSSADASNFTTATDAERKRLLEALTGVEKLEAGYRAALDRAKAERSTADAAAREVAILTERVAGIRQRIADAVPPEDVPEPVEVDEEALPGLHEQAADASDDLSEAQAMIREADRRMAAAVAESAAAERERRRIDHDECPTCGQAIPETMKEAAKRLVAESEERARQITQEVEREIETLRTDMADLRAELDAAQDEIRRIEDAKRQASMTQRELDRIARLDEVRQAAVAELAQTRTDLAAAEARYKAAEVEARTFDAVARTLSTKGVRAALLSRTIGAVEAAGNAWLGRICDNRLRLHLKPYGETKRGGIKDSVALSIEMTPEAMLVSEDDEPAAFERGYLNASGGERRRLDVALCFALAEVAEVSRGEQHSTIFADEIFDALDAEGRGRVAEALRLLAEDRCVVVVAHDAAEQLRTVASKHLRVIDGTLQRV